MKPAACGVTGSHTHTHTHTHLQSLFGCLGDAAFRGQQRGGRRCDGDFGGELGDGGRDVELWHVVRDAGADPAGVWKLRLIVAGILLLV